MVMPCCCEAPGGVTVRVCRACVSLSYYQSASLRVCCKWAHGVVVSHPLSMREALGSIPSVPISGESTSLVVHAHHCSVNTMRMGHAEPPIATWCIG